MLFYYKYVPRSIYNNWTYLKEETSCYSSTEVSFIDLDLQNWTMNLRSPIWKNRVYVGWKRRRKPQPKGGSKNTNSTCLRTDHGWQGVRISGWWIWEGLSGRTGYMLDGKGEESSAKCGYKKYKLLRLSKNTSWMPRSKKQSYILHILLSTLPFYQGPALLLFYVHNKMIVLLSFGTIFGFRHYGC